MNRNLVPALAALCAATHAQTAPEPQLVNDPAKIINSTTYDLGERLLTVQEVTKEAMPMPPPPPVTAPTAGSTRLNNRTQVHQFLNLGAFIYKRANQPTRSLITYHPPGQQTAVTFWSSADWSLIASIGQLTATDGKIWRLNCMPCVIDLDRRVFRQVAQQAPAIPDMPAGPSTWQLVTGNPTPEQMAPIELFHAHYDANLKQLQADQKARLEEQQRLAAEALANPPVPQDITVQFRVLSPDEIVTSAKPATATEQ